MDPQASMRGRIKNAIPPTVRRTVKDAIPYRVLVALGLAQPMDDRDSLHDFWRQPSPDGNDPNGYLLPVHRSQALLRLVSPWLPTDADVLEVGCNVGRNLAYLRDNGYSSLSGIEISPTAVGLLRQNYPQLADADIRCGPAEVELLSYSDAQFDLVFTMAVLEHIHPSSSVVFDEMVRVGREILAIEPRGSASHRQHPHDIVELFVSPGMLLVSEAEMSDLPETSRDPALVGYVAWRFSN